jgi:acyl-CoA dehydrogenase
MARHENPAFAFFCANRHCSNRDGPKLQEFFMDFAHSDRVCGLQAKMQRFFEQYIYPNDALYLQQVAENRRNGRPFDPVPIVEDLKPRARDAGLWNLFLPHSPRAPQGLTNLEYAPLCEIIGHRSWSAEVFNCSAPDTGNMETIERYGTQAQKDEWLEPLLAGKIRSAFLMTEPAVASSDATNIQCSIRRAGDEYVITGRKWWSTGATDSRCKLFIVMGKTNPEAKRHQQQSMILVPADAKGVSVLRHLPVFGYDDAPHGHAEVDLKDVRVPVKNILLGEGRGFEIAQGRLGPGRIHHCMRSIGIAERALELMCQRLVSRTAFGQTLASQSIWHERIAESRCAIDQARLMVLKAAHMMDTVGNKVARKEIAMIKVIVPNMALKIIDWAIQAHGAAGVSDGLPLAHLWSGQRALRLADGPDEVHRGTVAKLELAKYASAPEQVEIPITRGC